MKLPHALKLMQVFGPEKGEVLLERGEQFEPARQQRFVGRVVSADAANIFVHNFLKTLETVDRQDEAWRNGPATISLRPTL